jgi:hypothetical protein
MFVGKNGFMVFCDACSFSLKVELADAVFLSILI